MTLSHLSIAFWFLGGSFFLVSSYFKNRARKEYLKAGDYWHKRVMELEAENRTRQ